MPTTIAIESRPVTMFGVRTSFQHLYLVKMIADERGRERVIRGDVGLNLTLITQADVPLASSPDARGFSPLMCDEAAAIAQVRTGTAAAGDRQAISPGALATAWRSSPRIEGPNSVIDLAR